MRLSDADAAAYVECSECGHPLEIHTTKGCGMQADGCPCRERWTVREIRAQRRQTGLPARPKD